LQFDVHSPAGVASHARSRSVNHSKSANSVNLYCNYRLTGLKRQTASGFTIISCNVSAVMHRKFSLKTCLTETAPTDSMPAENEARSMPVPLLQLSHGHRLNHIAGPLSLLKCTKNVVLLFLLQRQISNIFCEQAEARPILKKS